MSNPTETSPAIIARSYLLTDCIRGSNILGSLQLFRSYKPSNTALPALLVYVEVVDSYFSHESTR